MLSKAVAAKAKQVRKQNKPTSELSVNFDYSSRASQCFRERKLYRPGQLVSLPLMVKRQLKPVTSNTRISWRKVTINKPEQPMRTSSTSWSKSSCSTSSPVRSDTRRTQVNNCFLKVIVFILYIFRYRHAEAVLKIFLAKVCYASKKLLSTLQKCI